MSVPEPKYRIDDTVYEAVALPTSERLPCPDCNDTGQWELVTPKGDRFSTPCHRCQYRHGSSELPSLHKKTWAPATNALTIGQVRIEWPANREDPVQYMCRETGVGSGQVYHESKLYATEAAALEAAEMDCKVRAAEWRAKPEVIQQVSMSQIDLRRALGDKAASTVWACGYHFGQLRDAVSGWLEKECEFDPSSAQVELIERALDLEWHLDGKQNPLSELVQAARSGNAERLAAALVSFAFISEPSTEQVETL